MTRKIRQKQRIWLIIAFIVLGYAASKYDPERATNTTGQAAYQALFDGKQSNAQLEVSASVKKILADDLKGSRHQRFIIELANKQTILVAHNIDLAPRVENLNVGDQITVFGEYEWNSKGGVLHWTHHDPNHRHVTGWIRHDGKQYQ
jgi:hypothetical protein